MRGDDSGLGPLADLRPHGADNRGVPSSPTLLDRLNTDLPFPNPADQPSACVKEDPDGAEPLERPFEGEIHIEPLPHFFHARTFPVDRYNKPLCQQTRRKGNIVVVEPGPDVGTGMAYRHHAPLTTHLRVNDVNGPPMSSLLDTGASLSVIDRALLDALGGTVAGKPMPIRGLGSATSLGWATITFFLDATTERGRSVSVECTLDFHVIEAFAPGLCLGQDFISAHGVSICSRGGTAMIKAHGGELTFAVHDQLPAPFAHRPEVCVLRDAVVPARSHAWVPIDSASLAPGLDYTVHPRLSVDASESVRLAGPLAVIRSGTTHILLTNIGEADAHLSRRTPVADALVAQLGDVDVCSSHVFELVPGDPPAPQPQPSVFTAESDADPLEMCEHIDGDCFPSPAGGG
ncbi:hypothetical protein CF326_g7439 [Tilletia indica]|nr:hypothetical protein CF326_g7439 [Tilletia indica]